MHVGRGETWVGEKAPTIYILLLDRSETKVWTILGKNQLANCRYGEDEAEGWQLEEV
jgi:hypothetical protein